MGIHEAILAILISSHQPLGVAIKPMPDIVVCQRSVEKDEAIVKTKLVEKGIDGSNIKTLSACLNDADYARLMVLIAQEQTKETAQDSGLHI